MAGGRQAKPCIESLRELKEIFDSHSDSDFALLIRGERKVEMDLDSKVIAELRKWLQKVGGHRGSEE